MELNSFYKQIYETQFEAFISAARSITFAMQKEDKFFYDEQIKPQFNGSVLMEFFNKVRTFSIHEGESKVDFSKECFCTRHLLNFDGKGGCVVSIKSRNGNIIKKINLKSDAKAEIFLGGIGVPFNSGLWEKRYYFDCLNDCDLPDRTIVSVTDFCYQYLEILFESVNFYLENHK